MRALVTGGDGFIGHHLITHLLDRGQDVSATSLADTPVSGPEAYESADAVAWCRVDVRDPAALRDVVEDRRPDRIFHLAGYSSSAEARTHSSDALRVNVEGTLHVVEAAALAGRNGVRLVVAGSADAYGRGVLGAIDERVPLRPESIYGATKAAQDVIARGAGRALDVDVRVARLFPLVGPGQREAFVVPSFCRRALAIRDGGAPPRLRVGSLDVFRDFSDVRDGVRAIAALAELDAPRHRAYNVCSGRGTPIRTLLAWVIEAAGIDPEIVQDPTLVRRDEPESVVGDPSRLRAVTGWRVERDLHVAVQDTFDWLASTRPA